MTKLKSLVAAGAVALALSGTAANAAITTFAQFSAITSAPNVRWVNNGTTTSNGTGGRFYTTTNGTATAPGAVAVKFDYLAPILAPLGQINANFFMDITVANTPATASGANRIQDIPSGGFSFTSTQSFTVGSTFYAAGSNLLTGTFTSGQIFGTQTSGSFSGNSVDGTLIYTSDVLDFTNTISRDYSMSLTSITPSLFRGTVPTARALRTFRALATGSFSSDPAPIVNAIPEPQIWGLMVVGFGLVGVQVRRRSRQSAVAA